MLSVKDAQQRILANFTPLESTSVQLKAALGRILAQDIFSEIELPPFDNSSVDGFAVRSGDIPFADQGHPISLEVVADIPAGSVTNINLAAGQAARIMTGAVVPSGADAIVMVEDTDFTHQAAGSTAPDKVAIFAAVHNGDYIRKRGTDILAGQKILATGQKLRPQDIGMLAMLGMANIPVRKIPRVAIISSGDELLPINKPLEPGKIHDSNTYMLAGMVQSAGCEVIQMGVAADSYAAVQNLLNQSADSGADLIISSAGVSVGSHDFIKDVVEASGSLNFWKVNMRPGKPLAFGSFRNIPFFGLPGNPVSSFVSFLVFVQPVLDLLKGEKISARRTKKVILTEAIELDGRESYLRASVQHGNGQELASLAGHQGSGNLFSLVQANALLIIPSGVKSCPPGSEMEAWILET